MVTDIDIKKIASETIMSNNKDIKKVIVMDDEAPTTFKGKAKEWLADVWLSITCSFPLKQILNFKTYLRHRLTTKRHIIKTKLPKGTWIDTDSRMLYGMMSLLVEFIEKEGPFEIVNWDSDPDHAHARDEMVEIYVWWKNYENRNKEIEAALTDWHDSKFGKSEGWDKDWLNKINEPDTPEIKQKSEHLHKLEENLLKEEGDVLVRLVKIRGYLWT